MTPTTLDRLPAWAAELLAACRVGHLGVLDADGQPRVLPVTYAVHAGAVWTVIDNKPKRPGTEPARLRWLRSHPQAAITVDRYSDDWEELAWVQLLGRVDVLPAPACAEALGALARRYPQYVTDPPPGPVLRLNVQRTVCWRAGR